MMKITSSLLLLCSLNVNAIDIGYTRANNIVLKGASCSELYKEQKAICQWKKTIDVSFDFTSLEKPKCTTLNDGRKKIIIENCNPKFLKNYRSKKLYNDGANCWGTALNLKSVSAKPRFIWSKEMDYWMDSPICRKLEVGEQKKPGDILNIYGPEYIFARNEITKGTEFYSVLYPNRLDARNVEGGYSGFHNFLHSETYISDKITFGKESPNKDDRFLLNKISEVYGRARDTDCQENQSLSPHMRENGNLPRSIKSSKCGYFSIAYRCKNFNEYFKGEELGDIEKDILLEIDSLKKINAIVFKLQSDKSFELPQSYMFDYLKRADDSSSDALEKLKVKRSKNHEMLLTLKYFTAHGIRKSLEQAMLIPATEEL